MNAAFARHLSHHTHAHVILGCAMHCSINETHTHIDGIQANEGGQLIFVHVFRDDAIFITRTKRQQLNAGKQKTNPFWFDISGNGKI